LNVIKGVKNYSTNNNTTTKENDTSFFNSNICGFTNKDPMKNNILSSKELVGNKSRVLSPEDLIKELHLFMLDKGKVTTEELMEKFKPILVEDQPKLFKNMLHQIASFSKKTKTWRLKKDYA